MNKKVDYIKPQLIMVACKIEYGFAQTIPGPSGNINDYDFGEENF